MGVADDGPVRTPEGAAPVAGAASPPIAESVTRLATHPDVQKTLCRPETWPDAAAYFITNFCNTIDDKRQIRTLAPHGYLLQYIAFLERGRLEAKNLLTDKSRQMRLTWVAAAYFLWCLLFLEGFTAFTTTRKQDLVDDGGERSSYKSILGRIRHMFTRLPPHLKQKVVFSYMKIECEAMTSLIFGEAPTADSGRSFNVSRVLLDEAAKLPFDHLTIGAVKPMCPQGLILQSTQDGSDTMFAQLQEDIEKGNAPDWLLFTVDWKDDAEKRAGLRDALDDKEAERLGPKVSPWLLGATSGLKPDIIASEYLRSKEKSKRGLVYKEFHKEWHVRLGEPIPYDPNKELMVGVDYGSTGFGAAVIGQPVGDSQLICIADYELEGVGGASNHAENLWEILLGLGFEGDMSDVELIGGPDTESTERGSGQTVAGYYRSFGFTTIHQSRVAGPGSIDRRIGVMCTALYRRRIIISSACETLIGRFPQYRWPVNRVTGRIGGVRPAPGDANHIMDGFGYLGCEVFPEEDSAANFIDAGSAVRDGGGWHYQQDGSIQRPATRREEEEDVDIFASVSSGRAPRKTF